jgi:hypothetical protein
MSDIDPKEAHELGMDRRITRRDFLNGVATGVATSLVVANNGEPAMAQQRPAATERGVAADDYPPSLSGLAAAFFFQNALGEDKRILSSQSRT